MDRNQFLKSGLLMGGLAIAHPFSAHASTTSDIFSHEEIDEFVLAAHNDLEKTKSMVDRNPLILNCASQYIRGDFETAIGGASHMGREDIAQILLERGARLDIFNLTFLGYTDVVKKLIESSPNYLNSYGPHGFTLLHHAKMGKHQNFADWLQLKGLEEDIFKNIF